MRSLSHLLVVTVSVGICLLLSSATVTLAAGGNSNETVKPNHHHHHQEDDQGQDGLVRAPSHLVLHGNTYKKLLRFKHDCLKKIHARKKNAGASKARAKAGKAARKNRACKACRANMRAAKSMNGRLLKASCAKECGSGGGSPSPSPSSSRRQRQRRRRRRRSRRLQLENAFAGDQSLLQGHSHLMLSSFFPLGLAGLLSGHAGSARGQRLVTPEEKKKEMKKKHEMHKWIIFAGGKCPMDNKEVLKMYDAKYGNSTTSSDASGSDDSQDA